MSNFKKMTAIIVMAMLMGSFAMPEDFKNYVPNGPIKDLLTSRTLHLGLDLQGGTQLDYALDLRQAESYNNDNDDKNDVNIKQIVEGVRSALERRVNGLGVSEPNIYTADMAGEHHIIVELAGISDIEEAKKVVGKTVQLEFKEQNTEIDANAKENISKNANTTLEEAKKTSDFKALGEKLKTNDGKIEYESLAKFKDELDSKIKDKLWSAETGIYKEALETSDGFMMTAGNSFIEKTGIGIFKVGEKVVSPREKTIDGEDFATVAKETGTNYEDKEVALDYFSEELRTIISGLNIGSISDPVELSDKYVIVKLTAKNEQAEEVKASHILVAYNGSEGSTQTRTKEEALLRAQEVLAKVKAPNADFSALSKEYSDDPGASNGGDLGFFTKGKESPEFEAEAFALQINEISDITETPFGFHIIKKTDYKPAGAIKYTTQKITVAKTEANAKTKIDTFKTRVNSKKETVNEEKLNYERILYSTVPDPWKNTGLDGSKFVRAVLDKDQIGMPIVSIQFTEEGGNLFAELTERNIGKSIAIFVGGEKVSSPNVQNKIVGGSAHITGKFTLQEAANLAKELNTGAISAPIKLVGQNQVGATLGSDALNKSIIAGMIGLIVLVIYMVMQYRLLGLVASLSLLIYSIILIFILKVGLIASILVAISLGITALLAMGIQSTIKSRTNILVKILGVVSILAIIALLVWGNYEMLLKIKAVDISLVLTLAGVTGIILSIGMAVDANILIFERVKEELKDGKKITVAIAIGFDRAWASIRDSNVSSLITCAILAQFGSSIIRGFAINLAIGILVSMFTAITVTRLFLNTIIKPKKLVK